MAKIEPPEQQRIIFEVVVNKKELEVITVAIETLRGDTLTTLHSLAQREGKGGNFPFYFQKLLQPIES